MRSIFGAAITLILNISVGVRLNVTNTQNVINNVQSAIASLINSSPVGMSISLSQILSVVQATQGVVSAVMISPVLTTSNDLINVQPYQKPLVTDLNAQIQVTII